MSAFEVVHRDCGGTLSLPSSEGGVAGDSSGRERRAASGSPSRPEAAGAVWGPSQGSNTSPDLYQIVV